MAILSNAERLEVIKDKLNDFQTTIWDLTEGEYMFLYEQAERAESLYDRNLRIRKQRNFQRKEKQAWAIRAMELEKENARLKSFYNYMKDLNGTGLEITNWHLNGENEPFDNFFDSACEEMEETK